MRFAPKAEMFDSDDPVIHQFLNADLAGPIGMDEMAEGNTPRREPAAVGAPSAGE